ncbi:MAG: hypothetical protein CME36_01680 [unclassified Hahellaceae]|nr:hypothetical protein [Hahellaceae bacterium]|tara:strand:- start:40520 stop:41266 length:747 start_codon:yes stop_codon:yes gene_type:complete
MSRQSRDAEFMGYLTDLLTDEPELTEPAESPEPAKPAEPAEPAEPAAPAASPEPAEPQEPAQPPVSEPLPLASIVDKKASARIPEVDPPMAAYAGLPDVFDCLLFRVGPFKLALPLLGISSVHKYDETVHELPGMMSWILGIVQMPRERLCVVDMLSLFNRQAAQQTEPVQRLIVLYGSHWALASHDILEVRQLESADIRWRKPAAGSSRSWCVGTLAADLCILIDPRQLHIHLDRMLKSSAGGGFAD